ncbi:hypothetical protein [Acinetobacter gandensis]|uniref:hypothetical protein n=1 Tax=Acinetobacter gandensis TaxID=1443941 RepID=UPI003988A311
MKKSLIVLSICFVFAGCSSTPEEQRLEQYIEQTNTDKKERTIDWYYKHDYERKDVLNICYTIYLEAAEKAGYYSPDISEGKEKYLDSEVQKEMYESNEECNKAYKAQDLLDKYISDKSLPQELVENIANPQVTSASSEVVIDNLVTPTNMKDAQDAQDEQQEVKKPPTLDELTQKQ